MKKLTVLMLCLMMMFGLIAAACSNSDSGENAEDETRSEGTTASENPENKDNTASDNNETKKEDPAANDPVNLKVTTWYPEEYWTQVKEAYKEVAPHVNLEFVINTEDHANKVDLAAASDDEMDVIMLSDSTEYTQRVRLGLFEPMDKYLQKDGIDVAQEYALPSEIDGKHYALPGKMYLYFVMMNKDELDRVGLEVPEEWTWDEYLEYADQLTRGEGQDKMYGSYFHTWATFNQLALYSQADPDNVGVLKQDGSSNVMSPELRQSFEIRWKAEKELGAATPYAEMISQKMHYMPAFYNKKAAMIVIGSWMVASMGGTKDYPLDFNIAIAPYPKNKESDPTRAPMNGDYLGIYAKSKNKDEAYRFIRWFTTEGIMVQGKELPSWKNADLKQVIDNILASQPNPELAHKESLIHTLEVSEPNAIIVPPAYNGEAEDAVKAEFEKYILEEQDLDTAIQNAEKVVQDIIKKHS